MVVLRFQRRGSKNKPVFRLVAAEQRFPRDGRFIEVLGTYDPRRQKEKLAVKVERVRHWLEHGARPSMKAYLLLKGGYLRVLGSTLTRLKP